jgi:uncharacterized membrane protein YfcA
MRRRPSRTGSRNRRLDRTTGRDNPPLRRERSCRPRDHPGGRRKAPVAVAAAPQGGDARPIPCTGCPGLSSPVPAVAYWFMLPACVVIAGVSVFAGISGATLLLPLFFLGFPALGVPALTLPQAVSVALVLQVATFGLALYRYSTRRMVRWQLVRQVGAVSIPAALVGAFASPLLPVAVFRLLFAAGLVIVIPSLLRWRPPGAAAEQPRLTLGQLALAGGVGGLFTGVVSAGIGEAIRPVLTRHHLPMAVIAGTATTLVAVTVGAAIAASATRLAVTGKLTDLVWPVMVWGIPGAVLGQELGVRSQGRIPDRPVQVFLGLLFAVIAAGFVALALH